MRLLTARATVWHAGDGLVNPYVFTEGSDFTLVDAELAGRWEQLIAV